MMNQEDFQKILSRKSVRRYKPEYLDRDQLMDLQGFISRINSYREGIQLSFEVRNFYDDPSIAAVVGPYGKMMSPPHVLVPYLENAIGDYSDLGYLVQQVVLKLWMDGIGSCYIGCIHRQKKVLQALGVEETSRIAAFLFFGKPSEDQSLRLYRKVSKLLTRSEERRDLEELFVNQSREVDAGIEGTFSKVIEAGRYSPSAVNAQPWRFLIHGGELIIFAKRRKIGRVYDMNHDYALHDTGICMANIRIAAEMLGRSIQWLPVKNKWNEIDLPQELVPVAKFLVEELRSKVD